MKKILFIALVISSISVLGAGKGGAFLDPKEAGLDFVIQGEYIGEDAEGEKVGLNIIARGDGKYEGKGFMGGLPGDGWDPLSETLPLTIETNAGIGGEYSGEDAEGQKVGLKISSIGAGKFKGEGYSGGLPNDGWDQGDTLPLEIQKDGDKWKFTDSDLNEYEVKIKDGKLVAWLAGDKFAELNKVVEMKCTDPDNNMYEVKIKDGKLIAWLEGNKFAELKKVVRESPTLGAKPPKGAIVLFDGTSADKFKNAKISEDKLLIPRADSIQKFGSHKLHIEFFLPFKPKAKGQGRGNSGCYLQGRYEVQVLDSFGLEGRNNECGGIYSIKAPDLNMCYPPLSWQTYDIEFTAAKFKDGKKVEDARMTVLHNGVKIHDNVKLPKRTTASPLPEGPEPGYLHLQDHGNPVRYRNIWVLETK